MRGYPTQLRHTIAPIMLISVMFVLELTKPTSEQVFGFFPEYIANGEYWRAVTGQLLHINFNHLLLNVSGLALIWALHGEYYNVKHYCVTLLMALTAIGVALTFVTQVHYAGLSGVLHSMLVYGALIDIYKAKRTGWVILIGMFIKVGYEITFGASATTAELISANVATEAHLAGAVVGLIIGLLFIIVKRKKALN